MKKIFVNSEGQIRCGWKLLLAISTFILMIIVFQFAISGLCATPFGDLLEKNRNLCSAFNFVFQLLVEVIMIFVPIFFWKVIDKKSIAEMGLCRLKNNKGNLIFGLELGAISLTLVALILIVMGSIKMINGFLKPEFSFVLLSQLCLFIFVGFAEEIFTRGYCLSVLKQCKNKYVPYIGSAILFALMHSLNSGISLTAYINIFLVGVLFAYMVYKTDNLWMSIGYHITWNYFEGNVFGFLVSGNKAKGAIYSLEPVKNSIFNGGTFGPEGGIVVTLIIIVGIVAVSRLKTYRAK